MGDFMKQITINDINYEIVNDDFDIFNSTDISEMLTDYFWEYDYVFGDQSYNKIRLKGFYDSNNKKRNNINDIKQLNNYLKDYCAYRCKWFLLKKMQ